MIVGGIGATIVAGEVESITVGLAPQTAGRDRSTVGRAMAEATTAGQAMAVITAATVGVTTFAMSMTIGG
jgi:hypothetical protein